jgi:predicted amidohydrolase YtcJ
MFDSSRFVISQRWVSRACVALSFVSCFATATAAAADEPSRPTVLYHAHVFTAEYEHPYAEAVAIRGQTLDAFEAARKANPSNTLPFVLTHAQFVDPEDIPRFAELHVIAALQLLWAIADQSTNEQVKPFGGKIVYGHEP